MDEETRWRHEDAKRVNAMGDAARRLGIVIPVPDTPPKLNADGTYAETKDEEK